MRVAIVTSEFFSGLDATHGVELRAAVGDSSEDIGVARMIHELKRTAIHAAIDGFFIVQFHDGNSFLSLGSPFGFGQGNSLSGIFANLSTSANGTIGVESSSLDPAFFDDQHFETKIRCRFHRLAHDRKSLAACRLVVLGEEPACDHRYDEQEGNLRVLMQVAHYRYQDVHCLDFSLNSNAHHQDLWRWALLDERGSFYWFARDMLVLATTAQFYFPAVHSSHSFLSARKFT